MWLGAREWVRGKAWIVILLLILVAVILRWEGLSSFWINPDEGIYFSIITWPSSEQFWTEVSVNAHPPLFYLLLRLVAWLSEDFLWFRLVALVSGSLAIWGFYLLGRELSGPLTGIAAASFLTFSGTAIVQSQLMRPYMMQLALLVFALWFLVRHLRTERGRDLWPYSLLMLLATMTHYSSFFVASATMLVLAGLLLLGGIERRRIRALLLAHVPILLGMVLLYFLHLRPSLVDSALQRQAQTGWLRPHMIHSLADLWSNSWGLMRYAFGPDFEGPAAVLFVAGLVIAARRRRHWLYALPLAVLLVALLAAAMQQYPVGCSRHSMYLCTVIYPTAAFALGSGLLASGGHCLGTIAGAILLLLLREPLSAIDGAREVPPVQEQILRRESLVEMEQVLAGVRQSPGLIIMSQQTYYFLVPKYRTEREAREWSGDRAYFHFKWDQAQVAVNFSGWNMTLDPSAADTDRHFYRFLDRLDREVPDLGVRRQAPAVLILGGWGSPLAGHLQELDRRLPEQSRLIGRGAGVPGLIVFEYDTRSFMRNMEAAFEKRR